jgi:hypothetical protein
MSMGEKLEIIAENVPKVYESGKKAEYNDFWNNVGTTGDYAFAGTAWNKDIFKPNRNIGVGNSGFFYHNWQGTPYDLAAQLEELGVTMTLYSTADQQSFYCAWFTRIPSCDFSKCSGTFDRVFYQAPGTRLHTIDKIILPSEGKITSFNNPFVGCTKLKNVTFEGVIDKSIAFTPCPLTVASMKSIISCLKDFTGASEYSCTLTLKSSAFSALEAEGATAEYNGVACTWEELIDNKKWNLTLSS